MKTIYEQCEGNKERIEEGVVYRYATDIGGVGFWVKEDSILRFENCLVEKMRD